MFEESCQSKEQELVGKLCSIVALCPSCSNLSFTVRKTLIVHILSVFLPPNNMMAFKGEVAKPIGFYSCEEEDPCTGLYLMLVFCDVYWSFRMSLWDKIALVKRHLFV